VVVDVEGNAEFKLEGVAEDNGELETDDVGTVNY
jgi:hypothetical protein